MTENRTQFICIYILEGFYMDSLDIIVVFGQIKVEDYPSLDDLARALTEGLKNDVQKVRAIFTWIGLQGSNGSGSKDKNNNNQDSMSPQAVVQKVIQRKLSYNFLFTSLCR